MEPIQTTPPAPHPNPFLVFLSPVGPFGGRAFIDRESLASKLILAISDLGSNDDPTVPSLLSPVFQELVRPSFYLAQLEILKKLAQDIDEESKASLRDFVWSHLFAIVGQQSHSGDHRFIPVTLFTLSLPS